MPKINEILLKLEGVQYAASLDLNLGYYHIRTSKNASTLCTIILPWGKYHYKRLPMVVANASDIFQQKMNYLFHELDFICLYIHDLLILTKSDWIYHVQKLELSLNKLKGKGLKCNIERSFFYQTKMEYLGFWVTLNGVISINRNIEAINNMCCV